MNENPTSTPTGNDSKELLLFQMGPVQEFIAQAATPSDLWAGSYLLSSLILEGIKSIPDYESAVIFPNLAEDSTVLGAMENSLIPSIPNRFLALVPKGEGRSLAEAAKEKIGAKLLGLGESLAPGAKTQLEQFLQMTWAVLPERTGDMGKDYEAISRRLAMRRNVREFSPWREDDCTKVDGRNGKKDFLSGKETALDEERGAINLLKLAIAREKGRNTIQIQTKEDHYLAIIAMDGDKMGATLSNLGSEEKHREFSKRLAEFACETEGMIKTPGVLIYACGDDVLAAVPAKEAIDTARKLAKAFREKMAGFHWKDEEGREHPVSASAGVAVGHEKTPLLDLVHAAQDAEHRAKTDYGRNALALSVIKRSGETLEWGCNWDSLALQLHEDIVGSLQDELSARFPYKLASFLEPYTLDGKASSEMEEVVMRELENVWERSAREDSPVNRVARDYLHETFNNKRPQDFLTLFLCETFINRQRTED